LFISANTILINTNHLPMATSLKNLSEYNPSEIPSAATMRFGIIVSEWNNEITFALRDGAIKSLLNSGAKEEEISIDYVPGAFELTAGAKAFAETGKFDAIIVLGCVIQGESKHFDFVCNGVTQGITNLNTQYNIPFIFGVLTTDNLQQAIDRAGGKHGNKGDEAAFTAIKMVDFIRRASKS
jgi:6,7-dimethyl-8-ribityllumazine synthase